MAVIKIGVDVGERLLIIVQNSVGIILQQHFSLDVHSKVVISVMGLGRHLELVNLIHSN